MEVIFSSKLRICIAGKGRTRGKKPITREVNPGHLDAMTSNSWGDYLSAGLH